ncbi:MAG: DNA recombination protein RmuC [Gammaproteobacteria bacterium]|nr:DNA recombination protein RmuC [Gammaproteobacteria bacterium]
MVWLLTVAGFALGMTCSYLLLQRRMQQLQQHNAQLTTEIEVEKATHQERINAYDRVQQQLSANFAALSGEALKHNNEQFLKLAQENLKQFTQQAQHELGKKEQNIEHMVKPIRELLEKTEKQLQELDRDRKEAHGSISRYLETMSQTQQALHGETRNLVQALRRPEVRGQWGEITLRRLVELAGMVQHCDFFEQEHTITDDGAIRPDMIVRMPAGREIIVDVKTPLDAYLNAIEAKDDSERQRQLEHHARKVRERVRELASKAYWSQFKNSPDFVVLFIPGDHFLSAALDNDPGLLEDALRQKVILATPSSLVALLRAIAYGWSQQAVAANAEKIRELGEELYKRLQTFSGHLGKLGKSLGSSLEHYNSAVGSFQRQVLSGARKFNDMGLQTSAEPLSLEPVEKVIRELDQDP